MNYLTNYYKNLSEQLSDRVKLLENYLYEMDTQIAAGGEGGVKADVWHELKPERPFEPWDGGWWREVKPYDPELPGLPYRPERRNIPDNIRPHQERGKGIPPDPGPQPQPRDGETEEQYQERLRAWQAALRRREMWLKIRNYNVYTIPSGEYRDIRVWPNPPKMPYERIPDGRGGYIYDALPPFTVGDYYITENGDVWIVNQQGHWEQISA